jgi:hypothetical protein
MMEQRSARPEAAATPARAGGAGRALLLTLLVALGPLSTDL